MRRFLFGLLFLLLVAAGALSATAPSIVEISTSYGPLSSSVRTGGTTYPASTVAYGPVGTPVVIRGSNFGSSGTVSFHGAGGNTVSVGYSTVDATSISVTVPSGATTGNVVVTTGGQSSNGVLFMVTSGTSPANCSQLLPYSYRRAVTIDHTKIANTDQVNFPILISGTYSFLATVAHGGGVQSANGYDIIFTSDAAGLNKLDHEIESYNPATGAINFWVRIPVLSHSADTVIYLQYGNSSVTTSQENKIGVWDGNYRGVWHLGTGSSLSLADSTSNANNLTNTGATSATGQIGTAAQFNGSSQFMSIGTLGTESHSSTVTISAWVNTGTLGLSEIVSQTGSGNTFVPNLFTNGATKFVAEALQAGGSGDDATDTTSFNLGQWQYVTGAFDGSQVNLYVNGIRKASTAYTGNANNSSPNNNGWTIGNYIQNGSGSNWWHGSIDEVRVSSVVRSADWIIAEYNNQSSAANFYSVGSENGAVGIVPSITQLTPNSGPVGTVVTVTGANFGTAQGNGSVTFKGTAATVSSWTDTSISVTVPNGAITGNVVVTTASQTPSGGVNFTVTSLPTISSLSPNSGSVASSVVIAGSNFGQSQGNGRVTFNGMAATISNWRTSSITATVPSGASTGNVVVTAAGGDSSNGVNFTVTSAPNISTLNPTMGAIGASVVISGSNFGQSQGNGRVTFNGTAATISSWSATSITAVVPTGATTGNVLVTAAGGVTSNGVNFTVAPFIKSLTPSEGAPSVSVTIIGINFGASAGTVTFSGQSATVSSWSSSNIVAIVPNGVTTGNVIVTSNSSNGGLQSNGVVFTLGPTINSLTPNNGASGTSVTIAGLNFGTTTGTVTFAGTSATITSWSNTSIAVTVPNSASSGNVIVTNQGGVSSNGVNFAVLSSNGPIAYSYDQIGRLVGVVTASGDAAQYTYDAVGNILSITRIAANQPAIFTFTPTTGPSGTQVTISGSNFSATPAQNTVKFSGTTATIVSASTTSLVVTVPSGAATGAIAVTSPAGTVTSTNSFTVTASSAKPRIDSFTPVIAAQGGQITITGANFDLLPQNDRLVMNITAAPTPSSPAPTSTSLTMTIPSSSGSGHISLATPNGVAVSAGDVFIPPPNEPPVSQVFFTGRTTLNAPATTVTIPSAPGLGLLLFDGTAGHSVSVSATGVNGASFGLRVFRPDGALLVTGCGVSACFFDSQLLPLSGTYAVGVRDGSANVTVYDSTPITQPIMVGGSAINLNLSVPGQNAQLTFSGNTGQQVTVQITGNAISCIPGACVVVSLLNPDGNTLASTTSSAASFTLGPVTLTQTGVQTIFINPPGANTGTITVGVQ